MTGSRDRDPAAATPSLLARHATSVPEGTTIVVLRHGQTSWGAQGRFAGRQDVPLTDLGRAQAAATAARLAGTGIDAIVSSPLTRCRRTADLIADRTDPPGGVRVDDGLVDGTLGDWAGFTVEQIEQRWPAEFAAWRSDPDAAPPGGESFTEIRVRTDDVLDRLLAEHRGGRVVLVTHAATAKMLMASALCSESGIGYRIRIDNCSISQFVVDSDGSTLVTTINDTGHLD